MVKIIKKYLFLCLIALFVVSGCVDKPQTQEDKVGWNQTRYEEYSTFYQLINASGGDPTNVAFKIEDKLSEIPKDKNEFEKTWYLAFLNYKHGIEAGNALKNSLENCHKDYWGRSANDAYAYRPGEIECGNRNQAKRDAQYPAIKDYFNKAKEYRQKIEEWKPSKSLTPNVTLPVQDAIVMSPTPNTTLTHEKLPNAGEFMKMNKSSTYEEGKVKIMEFLKFDCSHCYDVHKSLPSLLKKYDGKITVTYIPIVWPKQSTKSIEAYIIAEQMGKGEEMRDALFQAKFVKGLDIMENTVVIEDVAASIGLGADFKTRLESDEAKKVALTNIEMMSDFDIQSTPIFIINGNINIDPPTITNLEAVLGSLIKENNNE